MVQTIESMAIDGVVTIANYPGTMTISEARGLVVSIMQTEAGQRSIAVRGDSTKIPFINLIYGTNLAKKVDGKLELVGDTRSYELLSGPFYHTLDRQLREVGL